MYQLEKFSATLLRLRKERGWTQTQLAEKIGIAPQSISKWECATGYPDVALFPIIAEVFAVPIGVLFGDAEEQPDKRFGMEEESPSPLKELRTKHPYALQGDQMKELFSFARRGGSLTEYYQNGAIYFLYKDEET